MTKKALLVGITILSLCANLPAAQAAELESPSTALRKLQRGFLNIALSPLEIVHALSQDKTKERVIPTWAAGLLRGGAFAAGRAAAGVYEMVTFPFPLPSGYEPVLYPEFTWEYFQEE